MKTFVELAADPQGTRYVTELKEGVMFLIMRGPGALCAYIGVPEVHPLAMFPYDDLPVDCHGGLTFSGEGDGIFRPKGWYWYGWDYGHLEDRSFRYISYGSHKEKHEWTVEAVHKDAQETIYQFTRLVKIAERISQRIWEARELRRANEGGQHPEDPATQPQKGPKEEPGDPIP